LALYPRSRTMAADMPRRDEACAEAGAGAVPKLQTARALAKGRDPFYRYKPERVLSAQTVAERRLLR